MLTTLSVRDFAIIEQAEVPLAAGMTALTGETGAGKSLLVDALLLLSGARADVGFIRAGAERAELAAEFDLAALPGLRSRLAELDLDDGPHCRLRRVLRRDGSSRAFVNDTAVGLATLREVAARLIEIHGQHEAQALLDPRQQLDLVDGYAGHAELRTEVARAAARWRRLRDERETLRREHKADPTAIEFLKLSRDELAAQALAPAALAELEAEQHRLAHVGELQSELQAAVAGLDGDDGPSVLGLLRSVQAAVERALPYDDRLRGALDLLASAAVEIDEAGSSLGKSLDHLELDPDRLAEVDRQLQGLHALSRKHRVAVAELPARVAELDREIQAADGAGERLEQIDAELAEALADYRRAATDLSKRRREAATRLGSAVAAVMRELGMGGGDFRVAVDSAAEPEPSASGDDSVEFLVAINAGVAASPLRKTASGGELSRIALAIEVAALDSDAVPTMVFDEVDAGIGGAVAEIVGRKLRLLGEKRQVLTVTHLPQVAALAHQHVAVRKSIRDGHTRTGFLPLSAAERTEEVARMLGGIEITAQTRAHAAEMLRRAG